MSETTVSIYVNCPICGEATNRIWKNDKTVADSYTAPLYGYICRRHDHVVVFDADGNLKYWCMDVTNAKSSEKSGFILPISCL